MMLLMFKKVMIEAIQDVIGKVMVVEIHEI